MNRRQDKTTDYCRDGDLSRLCDDLSHLCDLEFSSKNLNRTVLAHILFGVVPRNPKGKNQHLHHR
ncbi:hypothetical protein [Nostoc sp. 'Peltigera membranacea cyanobiont' 210A]|uniref:hypothetical protein n=1 Tax=Nostoc sp. 'Peltigera membranacea cyanobiont' 210A TaxID=2014529 RepID=UPI00117C2C8B|nr:hypothetical protein [Nostoc sp. 'Peltigera membranacea cyanobiont' 210A]